MIRSIKLRLTLFYIVISFITVSIFATILSVVFTQSIRHKFTSLVDIELYRQYEYIEEELLDAEEDSWQELIDSFVDNFSEKIYYVQIIKYSKETGWVTDILHKSQTVVSNAIHPNALFMSAKDYDAIQKKGFVFTTIKEHFEHPVRIFCAPFIEKRTSYVILQVGRDLTEMQARMSKTRFNISVLMIGFFIILVIIMFIFVKRLFSSVRSIINNVNKITESDLSVRLDSYESDDEIGELVNTFNELLSRLEESFVRIKHFSSEISHELKTPLTIIRGEIETVLKKERSPEEYKVKFESVLEEEYKLASIIDNILVLSRIDSKDPHILKKMSLDMVMLEAVEEKMKIARKKNISMNVLEFEELYINGVPGLIKSAMLNLIDNALKYSAANTSVTLSLERFDNKAHFTIKDKGPGIPSHLIAFLCDRFYRTETSKDIKGHGLGLAIVKKITELHNGEIKIESEVDKGATFKLIFPLCTIE